MALQLYNPDSQKKGQCQKIVTGNKTRNTLYFATPNSSKLECPKCGKFGHNRHDCPKSTEESDCYLCEVHGIKQYECPRKDKTGARIALSSQFGFPSSDELESRIALSSQFIAPSSTKFECRICGESDHNKNNCPVSPANVKKQQEEILVDNYMAWFNKNLPDLNMKLINAEQIKNFLNKIASSNSHHCKLVTKFGDIALYVTDKVYFFEEKNSKCPEALIWILRPVPLDEFIWFSEHGAVFLKMVYTEVKNDLESMVKELHQKGIITKIQFPYHQEEYYLIKEIAVMKNVQNNNTIIKGTEYIICKAYDQYKNDNRMSSLDIIPIVSEVKFVYGTK